MKTNNFFLKGMILMVLFSMIQIELSAQNKNEGNKTKNNPHEQSTPPSPPSPPPPPPPPLPDANQNDMHPPMNLPGLTDEQKARIDKLQLKQTESMTPMRNQIREKRARLATILTTTPVDMNAADAVADDLGKIRTAILKLMIRHDQALRNLLTPDQQIIFDARPKPFLHKPE